MSKFELSTYFFLGGGRSDMKGFIGCLKNVKIQESTLTMDSKGTVKLFLSLLVFKSFHTSQDSLYNWTKISSLEINNFQLKNDVEKWSRICFEIHRAPSEIPAKLPGQFSHYGQIFLHWAVATLKGQVGFQNKKFQTTFHHHF